jgi:hypothetical protein
MALSPRHRRAHHLLGAWIVYWAALLAVTLGPGVLAGRRVRGAPPNTSSVNFSFGDQGVQGAVKLHGETLWSVHAGLGEVMLWLTVPPLLIALVWLLLRPRPEGAATGAGAPRRGLGAGAPDWQSPAPAERDAAPPARRDR